MLFGTQLKKRNFFKTASDSYEVECISNHTVGNAATTKKNTANTVGWLNSPIHV